MQISASKSAITSKVKLLYSAVSNPQDCSKCFTLYFPDKPVQSDTFSTSLGEHPAIYHTHIHHLSIARYSFIQLSELEQCKVKNCVHDFYTAAQNVNPGPFSREFDALPLRYFAFDPLSYNRAVCKYCFHFPNYLQTMHHCITIFSE